MLKVRADSDIASRADVDAHVEPGSRQGLPVSCKDDVLRSEVERLGLDTGIRRDEQRRRSDRAIQLDAGTWIRSDRAVDAQLEPEPTGSKER